MELLSWQQRKKLTTTAEPTQAGTEGHYATMLDPEVYTQYGNNRREIPPHTPSTNQPDHRERTAQDVSDSG